MDNLTLEIKEKIQKLLQEKWSADRFYELFYEYKNFFGELRKESDRLREIDYNNFMDRKTVRNRDLYPYIPINEKHIFVTLARVIYYAKRKRGVDLKYFLDIGCGPGITLKIAELFGLKPLGIEICKLTSEHAEEKFPGKIFVGNAFDFDFSQLTNTLIYTFMPIRDPSLMRELGEKILKEIQNNCFWVEMYHMYYTRNVDSYNQRVVLYKEENKEARPLRLGLRNL